MAKNIDEKLLDHLLDLARLDVSKKDKPKLLRDMKQILAYFKTLEELDTAHVEPMTGGTFLKTVLREDEIDLDLKKKGIGDSGRVIQEFPEEKDGYLKAPPVF